MTRPGGRWRNWSRSVSVRPQYVERPTTVAAVQRAVQAAAQRGLRVKAIGASHSFSGIAAAPGVQLDLADLQGLVDVDRARSRVRIFAGTPLHRIPRLLAPFGLAMANLGDIDRQSIAGAISTGTHGTGARFGGIATQIVGVTLVQADGELLHVDETRNPELLPAVALGLGALGILVDVTIQCVPAYLLHAVELQEPLESVLDELPARAGAADHFEFYWFPHTEVALTKSQHRMPESARREPLPAFGKWVDETLLSNAVYRVTCAASVLLPALAPPVNRLGTRLIGDRTYTDRSHRVFTQSRRVRFREMEYALPVEETLPAFDEVRALIDRRGWRIEFPVEVRFAASDDLWLSTACGRDSGYIAVHRYWRADPSAYFREIEQILLAHGGRPHWGKMHTLGAEQLRERYPRFDDFLAARDRLDPERVFSNTYLDRVLGD
jgi:FAD-linked oxidoreductase